MRSRQAPTPNIFEVLSENTGYLVTFTEEWNVSSQSYDADVEYSSDLTSKVHHFVGQGVDSTLRAVAWVLATVDDLPPISLLEDSLERMRQRKIDLPEELVQVTARLAELDALIGATPDQEIREVRQAIGERQRLRKDEGDVRGAMRTIDESIDLSARDLRFYELAHSVVDAVRAGSLDVTAPVDEDLLTEAGVPDHETRRDLGAFIYYFTNSHLDSETRRLLIRPVRIA